MAYIAFIFNSHVAFPYFYCIFCDGGICCLALVQQNPKEVMYVSHRFYAPILFE